MLGCLKRGMTLLQICINKINVFFIIDRKHLGSKVKNMGALEDCVREKCKGVKFPLNSTEDFVAALPNGADEYCEAEGKKVTATDVAAVIEGKYPFNSLDDLVAFIVPLAK
jgi:hypothetical protein